MMKYEEATVWGGIWRISDSHLATSIAMKELQRIATTERVSTSLLQIKTTQRILECEIYFGSDSQDGTVEARDGYLDDILREHGMQTYSMNTLVEYFILEILG